MFSVPAILTVSASIALLPYAGVGSFDAFNVLLAEDTFQPMGTLYLFTRVFIEVGIVCPLSILYFVIVLKRVQRIGKSSTRHIQASKVESISINQDSYTSTKVNSTICGRELAASCPDIGVLTTNDATVDSKGDNQVRTYPRLTMKLHERTVSCQFLNLPSIEVGKTKIQSGQCGIYGKDPIEPSSSVPKAQDKGTNEYNLPVDKSAATVSDGPGTHNSTYSVNSLKIGNTCKVKRERKTGVTIKHVLYQKKTSRTSNVQTALECLKHVNYYSKSVKSVEPVSSIDNSNYKSAAPVKKIRSFSVGGNTIFDTFNIVSKRRRTVVMVGVYSLYVCVNSLLFSITLIINQMFSSSSVNTALASLCASSVALTYFNCVINACNSLNFTSITPSLISKRERKIATTALLN